MKNILENLLQIQELHFGPEAEQQAAKIGELRSTVPAPVLAHFDRLVTRGKKGVAIIRNRVCRGCHMGVALGTLITLRKNEDLQLCGSCGRYLYLPEDEALQEKPVATKIAKRRKAKAKADELEAEADEIAVA